MASPQKENGFTPIANEILDKLVNTPLLGAEYSVLFFVLRKTYGYQKKEDSISLTQFEKATGLSRPTVVKTLKNLIASGLLVNARLPSSISSFRFNKDYDSWVVNGRLLVKRKHKSGKPAFTKTSKGALTHKRKKESTKETTSKGKPLREYNPLGAEIIKAFEEVDPKNKTYYGNTTQRKACDFLLDEYGLEEVKKRISVLPKTNRLSYFPTITTPVQLRDKWVQLQDTVERKRSEVNRKKTIIV